MTIRGLLAAVVIPFFIITSLVVWKYFDIVYYRSLKIIETHFVTDQIAVIKKLASATSKRYVKLASDWGAWNDTYSFIIDKNAEYIESNLHPSTLETTDSDILMYINKNGDMIYALNRPSVAADTSDIAGFIKRNPLKGKTGSFFVRSPKTGKIFFGAYSYITSSDMDKPSRGYFITLLTLDRFINNTFKDSGLTMSYVTAVNKQVPCGGRITDSFTLDNNYIDISIEFPSLSPHSAVNMDFRMKREIFIFVNKMIDKTVLAVMLIFIIASTIMTVIMYMALLRRIGLITKDFSRLEASPDFGVRLPVKGTKELRLLAKTANKALDDITALNRKLTMMSNMDGLTGINNRRSFDTVMEKELKNAIRFSRNFSFLIIDIDNFKLFNDRHGHLTGDECLRIVAASIAGSLKRPADFAARYGGEEFAVILPDTDETGAISVAERIRNAVGSAAVMSDDGKCLEVTVSVGAHTCVPDHAATADDIIAQADKALYAAKRTKNVTVHSKDFE